jgi:hypothetical protein
MAATAAPPNDHAIQRRGDPDAAFGASFDTRTAFM